MLILDFDGTVTNAELEGAPFRAGYLGDIAVLTGRPLEEIEELATELEAEVRADPDAHGWMFNGNIVAPAAVDPYLRIMPVARKLFDRFDVISNDTDRSRLLDGILYKYNYEKTDLAFRDGAYELLSALVGTDSWVVTNSHTAPVRGKIERLDAGRDTLTWWGPRVRGRAQKYVVGNEPTAINPELTLPGLSRPVLLRRPHYYAVIEELLAISNSSWADLWVVGDIFELDLALPLALGASVALVVNDFTPPYERAFVFDHPRAHIVNDLCDIPGLIAA